MWGGELGLQGGEEGGLGMKKATGGKTQHGTLPSPRPSVHPEHSVQAGMGPEQDQHPEHSQLQNGEQG